ncbi:hypothetical protein LCGC14_0667530, partial [marine sediment metagenome]
PVKELLSDENGHRKALNLFLFACYTGMSISEVHSIRDKKFIKENGQGIVIHKRREKTDKYYTIPLPDFCIEVLEKYQYNLNILSSQRVNLYIKELLKHFPTFQNVSEEKKKDDVKKYGLDRPEYEITLGMPLANQEVIFSLHKEEDKLYATTSLSTKIVETEDTLLTDLEKEAEELREKKVASFYSWEANRLHLKKGEIDWIVAKDEEDNWHFESPLKEEADRSKIQTFIRKIESLEATEFIDPPLSLNLKEYGLDNPQAEVKIWIEENEDEENAKEITVLIGSEDKESKKVVVKNAQFDYLFRMDSAFLEEFPKDIKDWKPEEEEEKEEKKEKERP